MDLKQVVDNNLAKTNLGKVANYIPALGKVDPKQLGIAVYDLNKDNITNAGNADVRFAIESISKVIVFLYVAKQLGLSNVTKHVGARQT